MEKSEKILIAVIVTSIVVVAFALTYLNLYRAFEQPCDTMADWSTNVPVRCVKELK